MPQLHPRAGYGAGIDGGGGRRYVTLLYSNIYSWDLIKINRRKNQMKVAFIGLGTMGSEMAKNILNAGHELTVYNRTRSKGEPLAAAP